MRDDQDGRGKRFLPVGRLPNTLKTTRTVYHTTESVIVWVVTVIGRDCTVGPEEARPYTPHVTPVPYPRVSTYSSPILRTVNRVVDTGRSVPSTVPLPVHPGE